MSSVLRPARRRAQQPEQLGDESFAELSALLDADPLPNVVLAGRLERLGTLDPARIGGVVLGLRDGDGRLGAAVFAGGNLLPLGGTGADLQVIAIALASRRRTCNSIVGRTASVAALWDVLAPA